MNYFLHLEPIGKLLGYLENKAKVQTRWKRETTFKTTTWAPWSDILWYRMGSSIAQSQKLIWNKVKDRATEGILKVYLDAHCN